MIKTKFLRLVAENTLFPLLKDTSIKPQHLLIFRIIFAVITGFTLFMGDYKLIAIALTTYQFVFLLDYVDGKIARYRKEFSPKWRRVDRTAHYLVSAIFLLGVTYSTYIVSKDTLLLTFGVIGTVSILLTFTIDSIILSKYLSFDRLKKIQDNRGILHNFYSFLPIDGSFTLFYFLIIFKLPEIAIIFLGLLNIMIFAKKYRLMLKWKKKK